MKKTLRDFTMDVTGQESPEVQEVFDWYQSNFGFVPNLAKVMSASPATLRAYWLTQLNLQQHGVLTPEEHNVVQMAIAVENACKYCTAGHHLAGKMFFDSSEEDLQALRNGSSLSNQKFDALKEFALRVYRNHGRISDRALKEFYEAGYDQGQAIEVVTNIAAKVLSNYTNQLTLNELDEAAAPFAEGLSFAE